MKIDYRIFSEIKYAYPNVKSFTFHPELPKEELSDYYIIKRFIIIQNPKESDESGDEYNQRIDDEMDSYPLVGIVPFDSILSVALYDWQKAGHQLPWLSLNSAKTEEYGDHYFLTRDSNYNSVSDLFEDYSGKTQQEFLDFINAEN